MSFIINARTVLIRSVDVLFIQKLFLLKLSGEHVNVEILEGRWAALIAEHLEHVRELLSLLRMLTWRN